MRKIYFIRHAKSDWKKPYKSDFERGLNQRGKEDTKKMAHRLKSYGVMPDIVVSSPAKRAKKTAQKITKILGFKDIIYDMNLYENSYEKYLKVIEKIPAKYENIFIFGHNFTITQVCENLTKAMIGNMPTCSIVCIEFGNFMELKNQKAKLLFFDFPKNEDNIKYT